MCKYGFPWPLMDKTTILEPLAKDYPSERLLKLMTYYKNMQDLLNKWAKKAKEIYSNKYTEF